MLLKTPLKTTLKTKLKITLKAMLKILLMSFLENKKVLIWADFLLFRNFFITSFHSRLVFFWCIVDFHCS